MAYRSIFYRASIVFFIAICSIFTYQLSRLWGNPIELGLYWAKQNPQSSRAQRNAAMLLEKHSNGDLALQVIDQAKKNNPLSLEVLLHWLLLKCTYDVLTPADFDNAQLALAQIPYKINQLNLLEAVVTSGIAGTCKSITTERSIALLDSLLTNPSITNNPYLGYPMHHLKGVIYAHEKNAQQTADEFTAALNLSGKIEHGLRQTAILADNGFLREAKKHLEHTARLLPKTHSTSFLPGTMDYRFEIEELSKQIDQDIKDAVPYSHDGDDKNPK